MKILVWAGSDVYRVIEVAPHSSPRACFSELMQDVVETFGDGADIVRVSEDRYEITVEGVKVSE